MSSIPTKELIKIQEALEQKINESSDSEYSPSESDTSSSRSSRKNRYKTVDYKTKYNNSESKYRYLQLEMSNKNIEINELKEKLVTLDKHALIIKNISFLFERLDNAFKGLDEKITTINDPGIIKFATLSSLDITENMCIKTKDKYNIFINENIYPLFPENQIILKNSLTMYYLEKQKEFDKILLKIKIHKYRTTVNNIFRIMGLTILLLLFINILIMVIYYLVR
jgi:hypothetical protein